MSVARITEITASSKKSIDDAIKSGVERAARTLRNVSGVWIKDIKLEVEDGKVAEYRVAMKVTFVLD